MRIKCRLLVDELARLFPTKSLLELLQIEDVDELSAGKKSGPAFQLTSPVAHTLSVRLIMIAFDFKLLRVAA
jgi:hypothetical protein